MTAEATLAELRSRLDTLDAFVASNRMPDPSEDAGYGHICAGKMVECVDAQTQSKVEKLIDATLRTAMFLKKEQSTMMRNSGIQSLQSKAKRHKTSDV